MDGTAWWPGVASGPTCGSALGSFKASTVSDLAYTTGSYSVSIVPQAASLILAAFLAGDPNTPGDTGMGLSGAGVTTLQTLDFGANETTALGWAIGSAGAMATLTGTYTPGASPASSVECAALVAIRTAHATPVQTASGAFNPGSNPAFAATPTTGNLILMVQGIRGQPRGTVPTQASLTPATGWTLLAYATANPAEPFNMGAVAVWGRCAVAVEGKTYGQASGSESLAISILEWQP